MSQATRKPSTVGDILLYEYLEPSGLKINDLAEILNVHRNSASALINNNRKLSTDMAFRLAKAFETSAKFWLNIQLAVDLWEVTSSPRLQEEISRVSVVSEVVVRHEDNGSHLEGRKAHA
jgi:addiction module HigA family antidote